MALDAEEQLSLKLLCNEIECLHLRHGLVSYPDERPYWRCLDVNNYMDCMVNVMLMMLFY